LFGSPATHRGLTARLADATRCQVFVPDYRLDPFPAPLEDSLAAFAALTKTTPANKIIIAGDSAGGNLTVATLLALAEKGVSPAGGVCFSPWLDLSDKSPDNIKTLHNASSDPLIPAERIMEAAQLYAGKSALTNPLVSPVFASAGMSVSMFN